MKGQSSEFFRLSPQQQVLISKWMGSQKAGMNTHESADIDGWLQIARPLNQSLSMACLQKNIQSVIANYEILRTDFVNYNGEMVQSVLKECTPDIEYIDAVDQQVPEQFLQNFCEELYCQRYTPEQNKQVIFRIVHLGAGEHTLVIQASALVCDAYSLSLLADIVTSNKSGDEEIIQYADAAEWFYEIQQSNQQNSLFWVDRLKKCGGENPFKAILIGRENKRAEKRQLSFDLSQGLHERLVEFSGTIGQSVAMVMTSLWGVLLNKSCENGKVVLWDYLTMRGTPELDSLVGPCAKLTPLIVDNVSEQSFIQVFQNIATQRSMAVEKQQQLDVQALPQTIFFSSCINDGVLGVRGSSYQADIALIGYREGRLVVEYNAAHYGQHFINCLSFRLNHLLTTMLDNPHTSIGSATLLSEQEKALLCDVLGKGRIDKAVMPVIVKLQSLAKTQSDHIAIACAGQAINYGTLLNNVANTAQWLKQHALNPGDRIGIVGANNPELLYIWFACMAIGVTYITVENSEDTSRLNHIFSDANVALVVSTDAAIQTSLGDYQVEYLDAGTLAGYGCGLNTVAIAFNTTYLNEIAYCIYTSGSTGLPKGVEVSHGALAAYGTAISAFFPLSTQAEFTFFSSLTADLAYTSIFGAIYSGNTIRLLPKALGLEAEELFDALRQKPVSYLKVVPSHFQSLLDVSDTFDWLPKKGIIFGGEPLNLQMVEKLQAIVPNVQLINHYGPTETTVGAIANMITLADLHQQVPIGSPLAGYKAVVVNDTQLLPLGFEGELVIGGSSVAKGYLNNPELNNNKFKPMDFDPEQTPYFISGDLVRLNSAGEYVFLRRKDDQIKIRGFRVELGEIEHRLKELADIKDAAAFVVGEGAATHIVAAVVTINPLDIDNIKKQLALTLPAVMIPARFESVNSIIRTGAGKINRKALAEIHSASGADPVANIGEGEDTSTVGALVNIWQALLKNPQMTENDNFFDMGANSLLIIKARKIINSKFDADIKLVEFFKYTTIRKLAELIDAKGQ